MGAGPGRRPAVEVTLTLLLLAVALPAVAGGIGLLTGALEPPQDDLAGLSGQAFERHAGIDPERALQSREHLVDEAAIAPRPRRNRAARER